jgi:glucose/arabinose dehydrogenase
MKRSLLVVVSLVSLAALTSAQGQQPASGERPCSGGALDPTCAKIGTPAVPLPEGPIILDTAEQPRIRVVVITKALSRPWSVAFLPDGSLLVTELPGRLRIIRDGKLDSQPIAGVPTVRAGGLAGLMDVALHPKFAENRLLYLTYSKPGDQRQYTIALARARFDGKSLLDLRDIYVVSPMHTGASRLAFGRDGMLYMTSAGYSGKRAQDPNDAAGKVLRLRDDGTVPPDNPFAGRPGHRPEIYTMGHRSNLGLAVHPETGALWTTEHGPNGGDEINILAPGKNYGWPLVSYGRMYDGPRQSEVPWQAAFEQPFIFWVPSIAPTGITFYTGDKFPAWKGNAFVGGMRTGELPRTGRVERIAFNSRGEEMRRESLLLELKKRIRDVRQGPDGFLYVLTEDDMGGDGGEGALLRIEPAQ